MAYAVELTISAGNKVSVNYQSHEAGVSLTYQLEREDTDVLAIIQEKSIEAAKAHALVWQELREAKKRDHQNGVPASNPTSNPNGGKTSSKETDPEEEQTASSSATTAQLSALRALLPADWKEEALCQQLSIRYGHTRLEQLSTRQAAQWLLELQRKRRDEVQNRVQAQKN